MVFLLCRKCSVGAENRFVSSVGSTRPASMAIRYDVFLQMTWWSWRACAATAAVTTDASTACRIYWKHAWLRPIEEGDAGIEAAAGDSEKLRARLKVKVGRASVFLPIDRAFQVDRSFPTRGWPRARIALTEIRNGDIGILQALQMFALYVWQKILRKLDCDSWLRGPHQRTPTQSLNLQPGELVRVKSRAQIVQTLDHKMSNRGMRLCYEMMRCCGREAEVRYRVDRLINERTGRMREITDTVTLSSMRGCGSLGEECLCYGEPGTARAASLCTGGKSGSSV